MASSKQANWTNTAVRRFNSALFGKKEKLSVAAGEVEDKLSTSGLSTFSIISEDESYYTLSVESLTSSLRSQAVFENEEDQEVVASSSKMQRKFPGSSSVSGKSLSQAFSTLTRKGKALQSNHGRDEEKSEQLSLFYMHSDEARPRLKSIEVEGIDNDVIDPYVFVEIVDKNISTEIVNLDAPGRLGSENPLLQAHPIESNLDSHSRLVIPNWLSHPYISKDGQGELNTEGGACSERWSIQSNASGSSGDTSEHDYQVGSYLPGETMPRRFWNRRGGGIKDETDAQVKINNWNWMVEVQNDVVNTTFEPNPVPGRESPTIQDSLLDKALRTIVYDEATAILPRKRSLSRTRYPRASQLSLDERYGTEQANDHLPITARRRLHEPGTPGNEIGHNKLRKQYNEQLRLLFGSEVHPAEQYSGQAKNIRYVP